MYINNNIVNSTIDYYCHTLKHMLLFNFVLLTPLLLIFIIIKHKLLIGYDLTIGTSERGEIVDDFNMPDFK